MVVAVAQYFTAFHCQISISETQNRQMEKKERKEEHMAEKVKAGGVAKMLVREASHVYNNLCVSTSNLLDSGFSHRCIRIPCN